MRKSNTLTHPVRLQPCGNILKFRSRAFDEWAPELSLLEQRAQHESGVGGGARLEYPISHTHRTDTHFAQYKPSVSSHSQHIAFLLYKIRVCQSRFICSQCACSWSHLHNANTLAAPPPSIVRIQKFYIKTPRATDGRTDESFAGEWTSKMR